MKANKTKGLLILLLWVFNSCNLFAFGHYGNFESMTISEGLNNNTIYNVIRGQKGFIWLSTDMGISRYDGFYFRNFPFLMAAKVNQSTTHPISQAVTKIYSNADDLLFLQLSQGGITCFDNVKEAYIPVRFNRSLTNEKINSLYIADKNVLYIATTKGLFSADVKRESNGEKEDIYITLSKSPLMKGNISMLCSDDKGNLFFTVGGNQVIHYAMGTRRTKVIGGSSAQVSHLYVDGDYLWICRQWENPVCYQFNREISRTFSDVETSDRVRLSDTYITGIAKVDKQTYYLSTWNGLFCLRLSSTSIGDSPYTIECMTQKGRMNQLVIENKMTDLLWDDSQHILWIGTYGGGAVKVGFNQDVYSRVLQQFGVSINGMEEDAKGYIWLATERKGVWRSTTNTLTSATEFTPWTKGIAGTESYHIYKDKNGCFWLGDKNAGMVYIDPMTEETQRYQFTPSGIKNFTGNARQFCLDSRDRLWIATTKGVLLFDNKTSEFKLVLNYTGAVKNVFAIAEDKEGDIWLGTDIGLKRFETQTDKLNLIGDYEKQVGLEPSAVSALYVNSYNQIFAAYNDKMIRIDGREKDKVETLFTLTNGLSSAHLFCMIDDYNGNTWVGSNSGIMTIRNDRTSFYNYLVSGCCNQVCRLRDGRLLWADSWGLIFFDPLIVKNRQNQKQLLLTDLWVNSQSVAVGEEVNGQVILSAAPSAQSKFVFDADNNDFCFYFSDMQYGMMQRKVAYRLLPDEEWKMCLLEDGIHYSRLSSGKYTLQVKLIYPDASEGDVLEIPIVVKDYWWNTFWAWIIYLILLVGVGMAIYYYLLQREKKKLLYFNREASLHEELGVVRLQQEQDEEMEEIRNVVFTRFMRELRMPLSMIISPLREVLQEKELSKGLSSKMLVAYRNSIGMLNACDQLLNVFGYVPSKGPIKLAPYSIVKLTDAFVFSISELLRVHPIEFQYEKKVKKELEVWVDKKSLEIILKNMLYNAFIHIRHSGVVALILQDSLEDDVHYCSISVVDNGKSEVKIAEVLNTDKDVLAQTDSSEVELGFEMMESIMKQHHGIVLLENLKGGGTKVQVKWPIDKGIFEEDDNVVFVDPEEHEEVTLPDNGSPVKTTTELDEDLILLEEDVTPIEREKKTILVVEDYKDIRIYLKTLFEKEYNVLLAANGVEGVNLARKELPDLILCDVMMPLKDGFECCKELKEGIDTCHIPFILLTAKVEDDDIIRGLEIGADDYILKPFTPKILKVKVKNLIEGRMSLKAMYTKLLVTPLSEGDISVAEAKETEIEDPFISTVVKIIEENMQEPDFNVKKLASDLNMSQPTLYRKVKQCTDFTIIELIRGVRMRKAATLLKKKLYPVQEVAEMVGYNDIPTFRKHFVDTYGTTPSTYADSETAEKN